MKHDPVLARQRVNLLLDREIVSEARELGINLSKTVGQALANEVTKERARRWLEANREAIDSSNAWFEDRGMPYAELRVR
ncbi:type II toxin-antitoxin system CcdA family antitoxin [uncultured Sphingomonas sp.]|uniref:type II toxin-antitoxin system CcdA family antitoxin n=1 Tax=uncultured Sphingomonas sp. TaxID=158754 RepID=UPI0035CBD7AB